VPVACGGRGSPPPGDTESTEEGHKLTEIDQHLAKGTEEVSKAQGAAAAATGLAPGTPVVAGGGDGQAAGLGVNALAPWRAYLNLGTAVVSGIYSPEYRTGTAWRTMGSCSGEGYYFELGPSSPGGVSLV
jgi:xylulokinase